jgi:dipeptidyl aminopeptidase/acylaminoacyl peptidase
MRKDNQDDFWNNLYILKNKDLEKVKVEGTFLTPKLSPDGKSIAVIYTDNKKSVFQQHYKLYLYELKDSTFKCITSDIDRNVVNTVNSDSRYGSGRQIEWIDNKIYFIITDHGSTKLYVHEETNKYLLGENESIECFAKMDEGIVYISQKINHPTELYIMKNNIRKITNFNKYFYDLPKPKKYTIKASDGIMLDLWFLAKDNEQRPGILEIHGGPKSAYGNAFMFEFYVLVSFGFNVIYSNPRGSDGDNEEFALNVKGHFGERDYKDLMETVEYGVNNLSLIKEKMGVMGASYGGFMTNWIVGHTNLFSTAITDSSLCDQISDFGTSDIGPSYDVDQISGDLWGNLEHYWNKSPLKHAKNVRTPLLIIHSDEDYRCSIVQAYELYTALKYLKKEVNLAIFPGENHEISRSGMPSHRIERLNLIVQWLKKYLL